MKNKKLPNVDLNRQRFADNPDSDALNQAQQQGLNTMLDYFEKREKKVTKTLEKLKLNSL
jgi:hypothetical protein